MSARLYSTLLLCAAFILQPGALLAQTEPAAPDGVRAIAQGKQGVALFEQEKWLEASQTFREAEALFHSPVFVLYIGRSQRKLGQLLAARSTLRTLAQEALDPSAPAPWHKAQADARLELTEVTAEIPSVTLDVQGDGAQARLTVDGRPVERGLPIELDPGEHRASAIAGSRWHEQSFTLGTGARQQLVLRLPPRDVATTGAVAARPPHVARLPATRASAPGPYLPGWILAGTGAAAIAAGGVVGVLALNKNVALRDGLGEGQGCDGSRCLSSHQADVETHFEPARNLALASDVLWISGTVLAATGVTLLLVAARAPSREQASLRLQPGGASLDMRF